MVMSRDIDQLGCRASARLQHQGVTLLWSHTHPIIDIWIYSYKYIYESQPPTTRTHVHFRAGAGEAARNMICCHAAEDVSVARTMSPGARTRLAQGHRPHCRD